MVCSGANLDDRGDYRPGLTLRSIEPKLRPRGDLQKADEYQRSGRYCDASLLCINLLDNPEVEFKPKLLIGSRIVFTDGTPGNTNWVWAYGAGYLKTGWQGSIDRNGNVMGIDPATGNPAPYNQTSSATAAAAAIAFSVARGDMRRVQDFVNGVDINGLVNLQLV